jgi:tRNA(Ile2) C34 agmatinyltransferase TiaS
MDDIYLRNTSESEIKYKIHLDDVKIKNVLPMKGNHRCPFCNRTVEGPDKDLLCIDCSKYFRRKHYSKKNEK